MGIAVSSVVSVDISIGANFPERKGFGTLNIVTGESGPLDKDNRVQAYTSIDDIAEDWSPNSEVYKCANSYFSQQPKPKSLVVSFRSDDETITDALSSIQDHNGEWYGVVFTKEMRDDVTVNGEPGAEAAAAWCESRIKVFGNTTNNPDTLDGNVTDDISSMLSGKGLRRTITTYSSHPDEYPSASILGRAFTVNLNQPNSAITLKFKQMPGITVEQLRASEKKVLDDKSSNALIEVGKSDMYAESKMASGVFFDEVHGVDWLQNAIETNVFGYLLTRTTKVPYTNKGAAAIQQKLISGLDEGVRNGLIAPGKTIDGTFLPSGYSTTVPPVEDVNQSDKEDRFYPGVKFIALGAGAIHGVQINGAFGR